MAQQAETLTLLVIAIPLFILVHFFITYLETGSIPSLRRQFFWVKRTPTGHNIDSKVEVKLVGEKENSTEKFNDVPGVTGMTKEMAFHELDRLIFSHNPKVIIANRYFFRNIANVRFDKQTIIRRCESMCAIPDEAILTQFGRNIKSHAMVCHFLLT